MADEEAMSEQKSDAAEEVAAGGGDEPSCFVIRNSQPVKLLIGGKEFTSSSNTLKDSKLFAQMLSKAPKSGKPVTLEVDRNADYFRLCLDHMRGYDVKDSLRDQTVTALRKLYEDAVFYQVRPFRSLVRSMLHARFDPYMYSPLLVLSKKASDCRRTEYCPNSHQCAAVCGALSRKSRYVEINVVECRDNEGAIMFGVTTVDHFKVGGFPGNKQTPGVSLEAASGSIYAKGGMEAWGEKWTQGDRIGCLLEIEDKRTTARFYRNGKLQKKEINLSKLMPKQDGEDRFVFVVSLFYERERVSLVQNPVFPQER